MRNEVEFYIGGVIKCFNNINMQKIIDFLYENYESKEFDGIYIHKDDLCNVITKINKISINFNNGLELKKYVDEHIYKYLVNHYGLKTTYKDWIKNKYKNY